MIILHLASSICFQCLFAPCSLHSPMPKAPIITLDCFRALKASHLQHLALVTGTATSGPKLALATRLLSALHDARLPQLHGVHAPRRSSDALAPEAGSTQSHYLRNADLGAVPQHIVSLDMGMRNLAYCTLELPPHPTPAQTLSTSVFSGPCPVPTVRAWRRLELQSATLPQSPGAKGNVKKQKIAVVASWLESGTQVEFAGEAAETKDAFLDRWRGKPKDRARSAGAAEAGGPREGESKLDDLADCLLQGVAWLRWEENRRLILERGPNAVHEIAKER